MAALARGERLLTVNYGDSVVLKASRLDTVYDRGEDVKINLEDADTVLSSDGISEFCLVSVLSRTTSTPSDHSARAVCWERNNRSEICEKDRVRARRVRREQ